MPGSLDFSGHDLRRVDRLRREENAGRERSGAHAALPMWIEFMKVALAGKDPGTFQTTPMTPPNPSAMKVDTPDAAPAEDEVH